MPGRIQDEYEISMSTVVCTDQIGLALFVGPRGEIKRLEPKETREWSRRRNA